MPLISRVLKDENFEDDLRAYDSVTVFCLNGFMKTLTVAPKSGFIFTAVILGELGQMSDCFERQR